MNRERMQEVIEDMSMPHVCGDEPYGWDYDEQSGRMPHVCGDEPTYTGLSKNYATYAPRMWG